MIYALLDFDGIPVRYFNYPHVGAVRVGYGYFMDKFGEAML